MSCKRDISKIIFSILSELYSFSACMLSPVSHSRSQKKMLTFNQEKNNKKGDLNQQNLKVFQIWFINNEQKKLPFGPPEDIVCTSEY